VNSHIDNCAGGSIFVLYRDGSLISIGCVSFGLVGRFTWMDGSRIVKVEERYFTWAPGNSCWVDPIVS
jgi:hypothetical protein